MLILVSGCEMVVDTWKVCFWLLVAFFCWRERDVDLFLAVGLSISVFVWNCASI